MGNGPVIRNPTPSWLRPENASVFDSGVEKALRILASLIGADDPSGQVMGIAAPVDVPGGSGSPVVKAIEAISSKAKKGIKAFHGSPHDFDKFSLSKIGTGEGAQAYGHGLYFAEKEAVAKDYRNRLTDATADITEVTHRGQPLDLNTPEAHAAKLLGDSGAPLRELRSWGNRTAREAATGQDLGLEDIGKKAGMTGAEYYKRLNDFIQSANKREIAIKRGRMYEVNIDADPEDFLDWDAPLSKQPEKAKELVREGLKRAGYLGPNDNGPRQLESAMRSWKMEHGGMSEAKMEALISGRGDLLGKTPEEMSTRLYEAGIPGIKYLDGNSRGAGRGSRNYVVFDDALIEIRRKYGYLLPILGAAQFEQWTRQKAMEETGANPIDALAERKW